MPEPKLTEDDLKDILLAFSEARMKPYFNATNNSYRDAIRIYEINTNTPGKSITSAIKRPSYSCSISIFKFIACNGKVIKAIFQQNKQPHELCKNGYQLSVSVKMV